MDTKDTVLDDTGALRDNRRHPLLTECIRYTLLIGAGGLLAILSSYLMRQFGY